MVEKNVAMKAQIFVAGSQAECGKRSSCMPFSRVRDFLEQKLTGTPHSQIPPPWLLNGRLRGMLARMTCGTTFATSSFHQRSLSFGHHQMSIMTSRPGHHRQHTRNLVHFQRHCPCTLGAWKSRTQTAQTDVIRLSVYGDVLPLLVPFKITLD